MLSLSNEDVADVLHADSGIVDEAVHRAEVISGFFHCAEAIGPVRNVTFDRQKPALQRLLAGKLSQLAHFGSARRQLRHCHPHAAAQEGKRHGAPEPARAAGHEDGLVWRIRCVRRQYSTPHNPKACFGRMR